MEKIYTLTDEEMIVASGAAGSTENANYYLQQLKKRYASEAECKAVINAVTRSLVARKYLINFEEKGKNLIEDLHKILQIYTQPNKSIQLSNIGHPEEEEFILHHSNGEWIAQIKQDFLNHFYYIGSNNDAVDTMRKYIATPDNQLQSTEKYELQQDPFELLEIADTVTDETIDIKPFIEKMVADGLPSTMAQAFIIDYFTMAQSISIVPMMYQPQEVQLSYAIITVTGNENSWLIENHQGKFSLQLKTASSEQLILEMAVTLGR